ncbi:putative beta-galactosidase C [Geopyxis carbonaria]|nr:putative beta-galactosidase C [Geopyxis carbonaria]
MKILDLVVNAVLAASLFAGHVVGQKDNGMTKAVQWDRNSLYVHGERVYIFSGEFHYPRLPVPELWLDLFQKLRATGFNAVSIYFFWAYHSPNEDTLDFKTGAKDIQRLFDYAAEAGIWVISRAGPYINAETTAGGVALWTTTGAHGVPRTHDDANYNAWRPWIEGVGKIIARNGADKGGVVILNQHENEFIEDYHDPEWTGVKYMTQIDDAFVNGAGVRVPSSHNEKGMRGQSWSTDYKDVGGSVDIYGLDSYPNGFDCKNPNSKFTVVKSYFDWFEAYSPSQPSYMPEYQGGAFDPWGGYSFENCAQLTGTQFSDVFYKTLVAQKVSLISLYMTYGGTNWGGLAAPVVYTSYDYGAPLTESRIIRDKMRQIKSLTLFLRVSPDLRNTDMISNGTIFANTTAIYGMQQRNADTGAGFYWVHQNTSTSNAVVNFRLDVTTSAGNVTIPNVQLDGRESKIVVTDYRFGKHELLYSSAEVLTYAIVDSKPVLVLYLNTAQTGEFVLKKTSSKPVVYGSSAVKSVKSGKNMKITYTQTSGKTVLQFPGGPQVWLVDRITGWNIWAPALTRKPNLSASQHLLVQGPYLVRTAALSGASLALTGDVNATTTLEVAAPAGVHTLTWNGRRVSTQRTKYGTLTAKLPGPAAVTLPDLSKLTWKSTDALPERARAYDASSWTLANHTTTRNPTPPATLPVLYPDDYGFHVGIKLFRGTFDAPAGNSTPTGVTITALGGDAFGFSLFLNGAHLQSFAGAPAVASGTLQASFGNATLHAKDNVLLVVLDYHGHDQESVRPYGPRNPRGLSEARLTGESGAAFKEWRLTGNAGGEAELDKVRGVYNEGGLLPERLGWPQPGFPTPSTWAAHSPLNGTSEAGVQFYRTTFNLSLPAGHDVPLAFVFTPAAESAEGGEARVLLWVNGYMYGKYIPHIGPQTRFPVPPGILDGQGENTVAVAVWAQGDGGARLGGVALETEGVFRGEGFGWGFDGAYLRPAWVEGEREGYA